MRSEIQIQDIISRAEVAHSLLQQRFPEKGVVGSFTQDKMDTLYKRLYRVRVLLRAIRFEGLTLFRKNKIADMLVQYGYVAKSHANTNYLQMAYNDEIILVTQ